jgi:hypothetical protein
MIREVAEVRADKLHLLDGDTLKLNNKIWFDWLEVNHTFHYRLKDWIIFQVRKEQIGRGKFYWWMYYQIDGKQKRMYLGKSSNLTSKLLFVKATEMIFSQTEMAFPQQEPELPPQILSTIERVREDMTDSLKLLQDSYSNAIEYLMSHANSVGINVDSEALVQKIITEVDSRHLLNIKNFGTGEKHVRNSG